MGKRVAAETIYQTTPVAKGIRKRKRNTTAKGLRLNAATVASYWHENDDEDSSSNDTAAAINSTPRNQSSKQANNSSILLNSSLNHSGQVNLSGTGILNTDSPKPVYTLRPSVVNGTIMYDLKQKPWRLGRPIGKGNFGEIFLASDNITIPVSNDNAKFVVKIEPHSNGPLFVEIHCLMNTAKENSDQQDDDASNENKDENKNQNQPPSGIPDYIASGSHYFGDARYRFLVLQRFDRDLHSLIKNCRVQQKSVLTLAMQIVNVLEKLHDKGYCHNDVKAQNLMLSKCKYYKHQQQQQQQQTQQLKKSSNKSTANIKSKYNEYYEEKPQTTDSGNSSEQEANEEEDVYMGKRGFKSYKIDNDWVNDAEDEEDEDEEEAEEDEDFDDGSTSNSNSNSVDMYRTPVKKSRRAKRGRTAMVEFSGSNPVRSCRRQNTNTIYDDMVKSHYLRPHKRISYSELYNEDGLPIKENSKECVVISSDDESVEFVPSSVRRSGGGNKKSSNYSCSTNSKKSSHSSASSSSGSIEQKTRLTRRQEKLLLAQQKGNANSTTNTPSTLVQVEEDRIYLIDFGLASKFMDNGVHRPFVMDQRRAHDGTLEFTSRDAHMGAHSRRSDLECLGYNLMFWSQGYLPWKEAASQQQQEKVHRAKEYLMTDVREMLKQIYGKHVPKYLGEFLHSVGQLAYHERPDYARYKQLFEREYQALGYSSADMLLDSQEIMRTCIRVKEEIENKHKDILEMHKTNSQVMSIMKNLSVGSPFHERTISNRVSPKNLRSKTDKKSMKKKKFSWAEILSQDPDQIARERAEKEFDREEELSEVQQPMRRYEGKPTYAILEILSRIKDKGRLDENQDQDMEEEENMEEDEDNEEEDEEIEDEEMEECEASDNNEELDNDEDADEEVDDDNEENDDDDEEEDEDEDEEESETDATEASEQLQQTNERRSRRRLRNEVQTTTTSTKKTSSKTTKLETKSYRNRSPGKRCSKTEKSSTQVEGNRKRSANSVANAIVVKKIITRTKSGSATRSRKSTVMAASAAGEVEHNQRYFENVGDGVLVKTTSSRRTRRCVLTADEASNTMEPTDEESASNYSLFNVWKKMSNENIYLKGSRLAASRHCRK